MANNTTGSGSGSSGNAPSLVYQLTSGKAYDPDAVYIDASDAKGHYEQLAVKLPPRLQHCIEILVAESEDFRSKQDFIRSALFHYAHRYATVPPDPDPLAVQLVEAEASRTRTEMRTRIREEQNLDFKRATEAVEDMLRDRDFFAVNEELDRIALLSEDYDIPEGVRERYSDLWAELNDALTREQVRLMKRDNQLKQRRNEHQNT